MTTSPIAGGGGSTFFFSTSAPVLAGPGGFTEMGAAACSGVSTMELNPAPAPAPGGANDHGSGGGRVMPADGRVGAGERELSIAPASFGGPAFAFRGRLALELGMLALVRGPGAAETETEVGRRGAVMLELDVGGLRSTIPRGGVGAGAVVIVCDSAEGPGVEEAPEFELLLPALEARAALNREVFLFAATGALSSTGGGAGAGDFDIEVDPLRTWDGDPISWPPTTAGGAVGFDESTAAAADDEGMG